MKHYLIILLIIIFSCSSPEKERNPGKTIFDINMLKGRWQFCGEFHAYWLMEFADSAYGYFQQENFIGPSVTFGYEIRGDSLIFKSKWIDDYVWLIREFDSDSLLVTEDKDTITCRKVDFELPLKNFAMGKWNEYADQYATLKKNFSCK